MRFFIACCVLAVPLLAASAAEPAFTVLAFSKTAAFRHSSILKGHAMLAELAAAEGFRIESSEDAARFTDDGLAPFAVVVFLSTTGDVLDDAQQAAFERFIRGGKGFVGIHSATDTEYGWPWYTGLVGAQFAGHPHPYPAILRVVDRRHPSTAHLAATWARSDEWYDFKNMAADLTVLIEFDEDGANGNHHPVSWYHAYDGGRAWYTAGGHTDESYAEPDFRRHVLGGIRWAAGVEPVTGAASK